MVKVKSTKREKNVPRKFFETAMGPLSATQNFASEKKSEKESLNDFSTKICFLKPHLTTSLGKRQS
jgi:hypothetical protein